MLHSTSNNFHSYYLCGNLVLSNNYSPLFPHGRKNSHNNFIMYHSSLAKQVSLLKQQCAYK